jgi:3-phosphoshikimate 1-carboxyvinyltransferase
VNEQHADMKARSPWSTLNEIEAVSISPSNKPINTQYIIPGSKSFTNRALIMAAMANGETEIRGILRSDDSYWCIDTLRKLGVNIEVSNDLVKITGVNCNWPSKNGELYIGAAGTIARFLPGALAAATDGEWIIRASQRMQERPVKPLIDALIHIGASITYLEKEGYYPIKITGNGLKGGKVPISGNVSSQFISGLLIASPYASNEVHIEVPDHIVQHAYVTITLDLMRDFGVDVMASSSMNDFSVLPSSFTGKPVQLEADASTASYFFALAAITNGKVRVNNLSYNTNQPDVKMVDVFERMGCKVIKGEGYIQLEGTDNLKGGFTISMKEMSDQTLTLAAISPFADGPITITDVAHIRHHESDRIHAMCESLRKLGIEVEEFDDGLKVYPGIPTPEVLSSYDDHRVAMSLSLIGAVIPGITVQNPGCISKTCPTYFDLLESAGLIVTKS